MNFNVSLTEPQNFTIQSLSYSAEIHWVQEMDSDACPNDNDGTRLCCVPGTNKALRDWSLITGRGGYNTGGGACEVLPLPKGGEEKVLAMLKGGTKLLGVVLTQ